MFDNGDKWINHNYRNYWKLQLILIVTIIDRGEKLNFAGSISNDCIDWLRILLKHC